ncbi:MAG: hypothetical protein E6Q97_02840 [Desulfurellales bacterium]|nr:MAG: hypothetical protein E6Q97_02840 [Desulfurellales bacterium]
MNLEARAPHPLRNDPVVRALLQAADACNAAFAAACAAFATAWDLDDADQLRLELLAKILGVPYGVSGSVPKETLRVRLRVRIARDRSNGTIAQFEHMLRLLNPTGTLSVAHENDYTVILKTSLPLDEATAREQIATLTPGVNVGSRLLLEVAPETPFVFDGFDGGGWDVGDWCDRYEAPAGAIIASGGV